MNKELFEKYFNNQCSPDEVKEVVKWFREETQGLSDHHILQRIWEEYNPVAEADDERRYDLILNKVHHLIELSQYGRETTGGGKKAIRYLKLTGKILTRAAAVLFLPLLAYLFYTQTSTEMRWIAGNHQSSDTIEVATPVGSKTFVKLSDGTGVHLNYGSSLRYPQKFSGKKRYVKLTGEAYFDVAHDPRKPFLVETSSLAICAVGTSFNVRAYPDVPYVETTLVNGKVILGKMDHGSSFRRFCVMEPGHYVRYFSENNTYTCKKDETGKNTAWISGVLIFRDDPMSEVTYQLSKWYNVDFEFRNEAVRELTYTATFVDETLPQILDLLKMATPIKYTITQRVKQPDGTFSKQKVIIDHK